MPLNLQAFSFFTSRGWSPAQAAGIVGNLHYEGGFNPSRPGDGGAAIGNAQWHSDRQAIFQRVYGQPIASASNEQQWAFVDYELHHNESRAGTLLGQATTPEQATRIVAQYYERPANLSSLPQRTSLANRVLAGAGQVVQGNGRQVLRNVLGDTAGNAASDVLGRAGDLLNQSGNMAEHAIENAVPGSSIAFDLAHNILGVGGDENSCNLNPFCYLRQWITSSGFFARLALAVLAFIVLLAAFYMMKGENFGQATSRIRKGLTNG
jgi:hypothetical protein